MWIPIIGLLIGLMIGGLLPIKLPVVTPQIFAVIALTSADSLFSGFLAKIEGKFSVSFFIIEFILNSLLALGMVYVGYILNIDLLMPLAVIFGVKIFHNLSQTNQKLFVHR